MDKKILKQKNVKKRLCILTKKSGGFLFGQNMWGRGAYFGYIDKIPADMVSACVFYLRLRSLPRILWLHVVCNSKTKQLPFTS